MKNTLGQRSSKTMKIGFLVICALASLSVACGCNLGAVFSDLIGVTQGIGKSVKEDREIAGVRAVEISNQGDLFIELGEDESLVIEAQENLLPFIQSEVRDGTLRIFTSGTQVVRPTSSIRYYLTLKELDRVVLTSSGDAHIPGVKADEFTIRVTSSGDIEMEGLYADLLDVQISSSGNVLIQEGEVGEQMVMLTSSGDFEAERLKSEMARAMLTSSGNATIYVTEDLEASLSSSGDLYYRGNPTIKVNVSSSGNIVQLDD